MPGRFCVTRRSLGRTRNLGLSTFPYMSLAEAREKAFEYRRMAKAGQDPSAVYASAGTTKVEHDSKAPTFWKAAAAVIDLHRPTWRNPKSAAQWEAPLRGYAYPVLGDMRVDEIRSGDVLRALRPIWNAKRETAQRTRQRISAAMKAAIAADHRLDNPAGDALTAALPKGGRSNDISERCRMGKWQRHWTGRDGRALIRLRNSASSSWC